MNALDLVLGLFLLCGLIRGFSKGLILEIAALLALILGFWGALSLEPLLVPYLSQIMDIAPEYIKIISYVVLFIAIAYAISLLAQALTKVLKIVALGLLNRILGGLFGLTKWCVILSIVLMLFEQINGLVTVIAPEVVAQSVFYPFLIQLGDFLFEWLGHQEAFPTEIL